MTFCMSPRISPGDAMNGKSSFAIINDLDENGRGGFPELLINSIDVAYRAVGQNVDRPPPTRLEVCAAAAPFLDPAKSQDVLVRVEHVAKLDYRVIAREHLPFVLGPDRAAISRKIILGFYRRGPELHPTRTAQGGFHAVGLHHHS